MCKMKILIVIDMQKDFIDGSLGTKEAVEIVPAVVEKIRNWNGKVVATRDTHSSDYIQTQEGILLPVVHCIKNTEGWQINSDVKNALELKRAQIIDKPSFGSLELADLMKKEQPEEIELIGLCTDICVVSNALILKAALPEVPMYVDTSCCAGVTVEKHLAALETMRSCQINTERK